MMDSSMGRTACAGVKLFKLGRCGTLMRSRLELPRTWLDFTDGVVAAVVRPRAGAALLRRS